MAKKSKILYIITKSVWAGAGKYVYDLATGLPKDRFSAQGGPASGWEVFVAAGGNGPLAQKLKEAGIPYFEIKHFQKGISIYKDMIAYFEILFLLLKIKPDIVHVNSSKAGAIAGDAIFDYKLLTLNLKLKTIFTAHGWAFHENRPKWQIWLIKLFSKITCFYYSKIICVSEYDYQSAIKNKIAPKKKLVVIHNGIRPEDYNFYERTEKRFTVGTIGEATKNKGHEYLMETARNFSDINFNIISNLPDAARHLKNFDIFVLPSLKEGLPYVLLEAGLAELPVIATAVGGVPEIIEDNKTGILVNPANSQELAEAIKKLIKNSSLCQKLSQSLHQKILQEFSFGEMLDRTLTAYEK